MWWRWKKGPTWTSSVWREGNRSQQLPSPRNTVGPVTCWFRSLTYSLLQFASPSLISGYEWKKLSSFDGKYTIQVSKSDAGSYKCRAENGLEPSVESDFVLQVSGTVWGKFVFWACFTRHWAQYLVLSRNEALLRHKDFLWVCLAISSPKMKALSPLLVLLTFLPNFILTCE